MINFYFIHFFFHFILYFTFEYITIIIIVSSYCRHIGSYISYWVVLVRVEWMCVRHSIESRTSQVNESVLRDRASVLSRIRSIKFVYGGTHKKKSCLLLFCIVHVSVWVSISAIYSLLLHINDRFSKHVFVYGIVYTVYMLHNTKYKYTDNKNMLFFVLLYIFGTQYKDYLMLRSFAADYKIMLVCMLF